MRILKAAAFVAALSIVPLGAYAQSTPTAKKAAPAAKSSVATHTTAGTVKSSTDSALVITKGGKDQTFTVNSSTEKTGTIENGSHVTVHYTMDGKNMVATAITVQPAKAKGKK